ncbi:hypothetical protein [Acidisoma silvae]|uniref:Uncharacterized protein n=1 Tax=Acidisoma silvae TaxID=2802396 RepID=A0A963YVW7_9PROT|nr:hypothetical protein [Acidisoma silvae]MCB8877810.1 hypothetical protein [Acidisoma silvae]
MARSRHIYTLKQVATMIGENLELLEEITANPDNVSEGQMFYVSDGSEDGTTGLTEDGVNELQELFADIRTWEGGIWELFVREQCDPETTERILVDELKRQP